MPNLRRVVTITFDPSQEIGELEVGPVFTDEYSSLVVSDDPSDTDSLLRLDLSLIHISEPTRQVR